MCCVRIVFITTLTGSCEVLHKIRRGIRWKTISSVDDYVEDLVLLASNHQDMQCHLAGIFTGLLVEAISCEIVHF